VNPRGVCSVGTSDPWNASGLGLDIRTLAEFGVPAFTVVAGVSAQDAAGLHAGAAVAPALIAAQFAALAAAPIGAVRVGALLDAASVAAVAESLDRWNVPVVYDPVAGPSAGGRFVDGAMHAAIAERLLPRVTIVTPNRAEAGEFAGFPVESLQDMERAARSLTKLGARAALIKGFIDGERAIDVLLDGGDLRRLESVRIDQPMRGTGCLLAAALAAELARGNDLGAAVDVARAFVARKLLAGRPLGGMRVPP
jgi:hydroxymethylpyrimidine/phosphomethylpyrimidine kinase